MKKPVFAILLSALFALSLPACKEQGSPLVSPTADPAFKITASPAPSESPTETPTEEPTEAPSEAPTAAPSERVLPYNREEYDTLLAFFELADESGVKNGEKCFKNYDPTRIDFWGEERANDDNSWLFWNDSGNLTVIDLYGTEAQPTELVGELKLHGFNSLEDIRMRYITLENADIKDCIKLNTLDALKTTGKLSLIGDYMECFRLNSDTYCHYENSEHDSSFGGALAFTTDITVDGGGDVGVNGFMDTHYYIVKIYAHPIEGHKFIGWYDADGKLISAESEIELSYEHDTGWSVHDFTGIAKFE